VLQVTNFVGTLLQCIFVVFLPVILVILETFTEGGDENPLFFLLKIKFVSEFEKDEKG
jgi:hypothetical protein